MSNKWRVHYRESERGWGQDFFHQDFDTREEAQAAYDECNAQNTAPVAPDYYIQAERIEEVWVDDTPDTGYVGKHRATEAVNESFNR